MSAPEQLQEVTFEYIDEVNPNLYCCICHSPFFDPVTTLTCQHTFCRDCITSSIHHTDPYKTPLCPIDRSEIHLDSLVDESPIVRNMLEELEVKCGHEACGMVIQRGLLKSHMAGCAARDVKCCITGCGLELKRGDVAEHAMNGCEERQMKCGDCGTLVRFKNKSTHLHEKDATNPAECSCPNPSPEGQHRWSCPSALAPCPHIDTGCHEIIPRLQIAQHLQTCFYEKIGPCLANLNGRIKKLEESHETMSLALAASLRNQSQRGIDSVTARIVAELQEQRLADRATASGEVPGDTASTTDGVVVPAAVQSDDGVLVAPTPDISATEESEASPTPVASSTDLSTPIINTSHHVVHAPTLGLEGRSSMQDMRTVILHLFDRMQGMERTHEARATTGELTLREEVDTLRGMVDVLRTQVMSRSQNSPGTSTPRPTSISTSSHAHSASISRSHSRHHNTPSHSYENNNPNENTIFAAEPEAEAEEERVSTPRESIAFSSSIHDMTDSRSETSSIISHITANNPIRREIRRPMGFGQPMGMPPEMGDGTPSVRVVVHRPSGPLVQPRVGRHRTSVLDRLMPARASRSSRSSGQL